MSTRYKNTVIAPSGNFGSLTVSGTQISLQDFTNWDTAYGWGDHGAVGYITDYTVTQADVTNHQAALSITESQISDLGSYITDYTVTQADVTNHQAALSITESQISDLGSYITGYTVTEADVTGHQEALHVTTTVNTYSADWESTHTTTGAYSADWQSVTTQVNSLSDSWTGGSGGITTIAGATDTDISNPTKGDILVFQNSSSNSWTGKKDRASLESMYNYANNNFYSELGYTDTQLTSIYVWVNSTKNTPLFERDLTYDSNNNLTQVVTKDVQGGSTRQTLTKTLAYDSSNNLINITRVYT